MRYRFLGLAKNQAKDRLRQVDAPRANLLQCQLLTILRAGYSYHSHYCKLFGTIMCIGEPENTGRLDIHEVGRRDQQGV